MTFSTASVDPLADRLVCFAGNAVAGRGGQGEFLRQMVFTLDQLPRARVLSRGAITTRAQAVDLPFRTFPHHALFRLVSTVRVLRHRADWLTLLSDLDFDRQLNANVEDVDLLDGVMAQCCDTFRTLKRRKTVLVLTCLNTHIDNLIETLVAEHRRIGFTGPSFIHPRMRQRALQEMELADGIRVNSELAKRTFVERGVPSTKIKVIRPAVDRRHFFPVEKRDSVFRVMAVSTVDPRKGIHYLLRAFDEARIPNSELVIIGGTGDRWSRNMFKEFAGRNHNVRQCFTNVTETPVGESYGSASVLVHPALEDGYGLVIPQALASGRPVIATRQSGASELVQDGRNGFVVESRSVRELKERLLLLANDHDLLETMSRAAPSAVAALDYADFARTLRSFYLAVLPHAVRPG